MSVLSVPVWGVLEDPVLQLGMISRASPSPLRGTLTPKTSPDADVRSFLYVQLGLDRRARSSPAEGPDLDQISEQARSRQTPACYLVSAILSNQILPRGVRSNLKPTEMI